MILRRLISSFQRQFRYRRRHRVLPRTNPVMRRFESLEDRRLLSFDPSGFEQEMMEHINRMRINPADELGVIFISTEEGDPNYFVSEDADVNTAVDFFNVDDATLLNQWAGLVPTNPLAWNEALYDAATAHSDRMILQDMQGHILPRDISLGLEEEDGLLDRAVDAGLEWSGNVTVAENVFAYSESVFHGHAAFTIDWGATATGIQDPAGHRDNIMDSSFQEIGIAVVAEDDNSTSVGPLVVTQDFAVRGNYGNARVLGVAYDDSNSDGFYNAGEGLGGVTITISNGSNTYVATTMTAGGYQVEVDPGTYNVIASGGGLTGQVYMGSVVVGSDNVKIDLNTADLPDSGTISGLVYQDVDQDGSMGAGESGMSGWTVYVDENGDGILNGNERSGITDGNGQYSIYDVIPGNASVRIVGQEYYRNTTVPLQTVNVLQGSETSAVNFGQFQWVTVSGSSATIEGTASADHVTWTSGSSSFQFNGATVSLNTGVQTVAFDLAAGDDSIVLTGSTGDDTVWLYAGSFSFSTQVASATGTSVEDIRVHSGGGLIDRAYLHDAEGDDNFYGYDTYATFAGAGLAHRVDDFDKVYAYAGSGGTDRAFLYDSAGDDVFTGRPEYGLLRGSSYEFFNRAEGFYRVFAYANAGGADSAYLFDSEGNDEFVGGPTSGLMRAADYSYYNSANSFERVYAYASGAGQDKATFFDSSGDDFYTGRSSYSIFSDADESYYHYADGFSLTYAYATEGGNDTARLYDSEFDDLVTARRDAVILRGPANEYYKSANDFANVYVYATEGGSDQAAFYDSTGDDKFTAKPTWARMEDFAGTEYANHVSGFENVTSQATNGGLDRAYLHDSSSSEDTFIGKSNYAVLRANDYSFSNYVGQFERVYAYSVGGADNAYLYDSGEDDLLTGRAEYSIMQAVSGSFYVSANGFDRVYAYALNGGNDLAYLYDSVEDDLFTARPGYSLMRSMANTYYRRAEGFGRVYAFAEFGGHDVAAFFDSSEDDVFTANGDLARMYGAGFDNRAAGFEEIEAYATSGGTDSAIVNSINFSLAQYGDWN